MPEKFTDTIIKSFSQVFKAEWSGAFVAILILALATWGTKLQDVLFFINKSYDHLK